MKGFTDYPFEELGDTLGKRAPTRPCEVLSWDGNKYCRVRVLGHEAEIKVGYIYRSRRKNPFRMRTLARNCNIQTFPSLY